MSGRAGRKEARLLIILTFGALATIVLALLIGCPFGPRSVDGNDPRVVEMLRATARVDRASLGFCPIEAGARFRREGRGPNYDALLHVDGPDEGASRTIFFRIIDGAYVWIGEQEIHQGPSTYRTVDGKSVEHLAISFQRERLQIAPVVGQTFVAYWGPDPRLTRSPSLEDIGPILKEWGASDHRDED